MQNLQKKKTTQKYSDSSQMWVDPYMDFTPHSDRNLQIIQNQLQINYLTARDRSVKSYFVSLWSKFTAIIKTARLHQWSKNILLFVPMFFLDSFSFESTVLLCMGFLSFGLCASSVYFINDIVDRESDRAHPVKMFRPIASRQLSVGLACITAGLLLAGSAVLANMFVSKDFLILLSLYFCTTCFYSFVLKTMPIMDVFVLSCLYTFRIYAGAWLLGMAGLSWWIGFSLMFFLSLSILKRCSELKASILTGSNVNKRRGYLKEDLSSLSTIGGSSGMVSLVFLAAFLNNGQFRDYFRYPDMLYCGCVCLGYWLCYMWVVVNRNKIGDDPVKFVTTNLCSYVVLLCIGMSWIIAKGVPF